MCKFQIFLCSIYGEIPKNPLSELCEKRKLTLTLKFELLYNIFNLGNNSVISIADTFASKVAAINDKYADSSIGNVTGSNAVNVFLGIGIAWSMAAIYWRVDDKDFIVKAGDLAMSVTVFCIMAVITIIILLIRRKFGGELGGPTTPKYITAFFLVGLWTLYIIISSLVSYCYIPGF